MSDPKHTPMDDDAYEGRDPAFFRTRRPGCRKAGPRLAERYATWPPAKQAKWRRLREHYKAMVLEVLSERYRRQGRKVGRVLKLSRQDLAEALGVSPALLYGYFEPEEIDALYEEALAKRRRGHAAAVLSWEDAIWMKVEKGDIQAARLWADYHLQKPAEQVEMSESMIRAICEAEGYDAERVLSAYRRGKQCAVFGIAPPTEEDEAHVLATAIGPAGQETPGNDP